MAYTVIWYGKQGIFEKAAFDAEKAAGWYWRRRCPGCG